MKKVIVQVARQVVVLHTVVVELPDETIGNIDPKLLLQEADTMPIYNSHIGQFHTGESETLDEVCILGATNESPHFQLTKTGKLVELGKN